PDESPAEAPAAAKAAPAATQPPASGTNFNYVKAVRNLCKLAQISEGRLLDLLSEMGSTDGSVTSLEELATYDSGNVLKLVHDQWPSIAEKIKKVGAA
ncbi:hypothetical protein, partial [Caballeronia sp.]|uniref:hypothetical protein n=1 Tax=Caballeronia sp. TaxID=1931223 RepID=UPI003C547F8F